MNTDITTSTQTTDDILAKVQAGIEHVEETGESFDIEMTEEEYLSYKKTLSSQTQTADTSVTSLANTTVVPAQEEKAEDVLASKKLPVVVRSGESMYEILVREFDFVTKIPKLGARYNALENILAAIKVSPTLYGITSGDVTKPNVGDSINIEKISSLLHDMTIAEKNIIDHANGLPDIVIAGIEEYMPQDAKEALQKNISRDTAIIKGQAEQKTEHPVEILNDPTGNHSLESGLEENRLTDGKTEDTETSAVNAPMTNLESEKVTTSLVAEMKLHNIPWKHVLLVGSEHVDSFVSQEHSDPMTQRIANLVKIHQVKTEIPVRAGVTVLEYLQATTLFMQRKSA